MDSSGCNEKPAGVLGRAAGALEWNDEIAFVYGFTARKIPISPVVSTV